MSGLSGTTSHRHPVHGTKYDVPMRDERLEVSATFDARHGYIASARERHNVQIDTRWTGGNAGDTRKYVAELLAVAPDVILAPGSLTVGPLLEATRAVPIVFVHVPDPRTR